MLEDARLNRRVGTVGIVVLVAAVLAFLLLEGQHLRPGLRVHVEVARSGALVEGAPVVLAGRRVGDVDAVRLAPGGVVLDLWIDRRWAHALHTNSELFQNQPSVLGEAYVEIGPPRGQEAGPGVADGATLRGVDPPRLDQIAQRSYENLRNVIDLVRNGFPEARRLVEELGKLSQAVDAIGAENDGAALGAARVRLWHEALAAWDDWKASGAGGEDVGRVVAHARDTLARVRAQVASLRGRVEMLLAQAEALRGRLSDQRLARVRLALAKVDELSGRAEALLAHAQEIVEMVARGEGSLGAFLNDPELADEFKAMTKMLKEQPWQMIGHPQK